MPTRHNQGRWMSASAYLAFEPEDSALAEQIGAALVAEGLSFAVPRPDTRRPEQAGILAVAVSDSKSVVTILSEASARAETAKRETRIALNNGRPVVPVLTAGELGDAWRGLPLDLEALIDLRAGPSPERLAAVAQAVKATQATGRVVAMLNIKGGVGKTVLAANLFAAAHLINHRTVAFVDLDPQHNLTQYFLPAEERNELRAENRTIHSVMMAHGPHAAARADFAQLAAPINRARGIGRGQLDLIAGDERLFEFTLDEPATADKHSAFVRFQALIAQLKARYSVVVIDVNPCATFLTRCAIAAADHIVAPVRPEKYSLTGLTMLEQVVRAVRGRALRPAEFSVVLNGVNDRTRSGQPGDVDAMTRNEIVQAPFFGSTLIEAAVPYSGALRATPMDRFVINPINVTALMRERQRDVKESLAHAAAEILKRAGVA
jgi:chromosome partitioning protein